MRDARAARSNAVRTRRVCTGRGRIRESEYLFQLREKQKCRRIYGLLEKQFKLIYNKANKQPGVTGENLLRLLELRIDNVVFRAGFASSRNQARQFVRHGHVSVNGKRVTIPSYTLRKGDVVSLRDKAKRMIVVRHNVDTLDRTVPQWLEADAGRAQGHRARSAAARADRDPGARAAHRRALLQVARTLPQN